MDNNIAVEDINNVMDDPEGGCIVQADDPHMLAVAAFGGLNTGSAITGNNSWYWTSMLKLMEQGPAAPSTSSTHNNNNTGAADHFTPGQQAIGLMPTSMSVSTSSPSSSSVHDQPINDMLANSHALNANDPDNSVWGQEFLSGPIGETKTSPSMHHLACSDDGLDELLYPRTVLELLFSDQLKLEQLPSWPDIIQQTASSGTPPGRNFGYPQLVPDKIMTSPAHHNVMSDNHHFDIKIPSHNYCHLGVGLADDRLSSSTATSALSENTINQWVPPNVAGTECEHARARAIHGMQQIDHTRVKQELYTEAPSPAYSNTDNINYLNNINDPKLLSQYMHHQQQIHLRLLADKTAGNVIHDEAMINHEITAANFSHNLRQGGLDANDYCQHVNNHDSTGVPVFDHSRVGPAPAASLHFINQPFHQLGKKSRSLDQGVGGVGANKGGAQVDKLAAPKKQTEIDTKPAHGILSSGHQPLQRLHMNSSSSSTGGTNYTTSSPKHHHHQQQQQQQLSGTEYNFKRSRIEQNPPPPTSSSSSFKSQPARKEKLSERIPTLQQLVSPFGKTDTASVLLEAIGYIKFLQDQVQALSSPYFKSPTTQSGDRSHNIDEAKPDLRSRGLCLVPLSCTMQIANDNGADYWYGGGFR